MSTYGDGGTTYGGLFGGGIALYGAFGAGVVDTSRSTKYRIYEHSAATLRERSSGQLHEIVGVTVHEQSRARVREQTDGTVSE